jgi:anti-sigma factor RsiW
VTCEELHKLLHDFVGNELVVESRTTVEVHIAGCEHCGILVQSYTHIVRVARALPKTRPLPPAFEARLRAMLAAELKDE